MSELNDLIAEDFHVKTPSTSCMKSAVFLPYTETPRRRISPTWACMPCSIAGRKARALPAAMAARFIASRKMGHVADIFTPDVLNQLPGELAIGHTRYSTTGDTVLLNAQPLSVACAKGQIAIAHNGNITNATEIRQELEQEGSIFQTTSDTEVVLHLVAKSRERTLPAALARCAAAVGRRVFTGVPGRRPHHCGA